MLTGDWLRLDRLLPQSARGSKVSVWCTQTTETNYFQCDIGCVGGIKCIFLFLPHDVVLCAMFTSLRWQFCHVHPSIKLVHVSKRQNIRFLPLVAASFQISCTIGAKLLPSHGSWSTGALWRSATANRSHISICVTKSFDRPCKNFPLI